MLIARDKAEKMVAEALEKFKDNKALTKGLKQEMDKYNITQGRTQKIINEAHTELEDMNIEILCLLTYSIDIVSNSEFISFYEIFTENELKDSVSLAGDKPKNSISFPQTIKEVTKVNDDQWIGTMTAQVLKKWYDSSLILYNTNTQREAKFRKDNVIPIPKIYPKAVKEIKEKMIKGELFSTQLTFNARLGTADGDMDVDYNPKERTLTIEKGTRFDCLDGFHRLTAIIMALYDNPSLDLNFEVRILNFDIPKARQFFAQMNTISAPVAQSRIDEFQEEKFENFTVKLLRDNSELKGKISTQDSVGNSSNSLVTFKSLSDSIERFFNLEERSDAIKVSRYLSKFFNELFMIYPDEFLGKLSEERQKTLLNRSIIFPMYVKLASEMYNRGFNVDKLEGALKEVDFSIDNPFWIEKGVLNSEKDIKTSVAKKVFLELADELVKKMGDVVNA